MVEAGLFIISMTSRALLQYLSTEVKLADGVSVQLYEIVVLLFCLYIFIKFIKRAFDSDPREGKGFY